MPKHSIFLRVFFICLSISGLAGSTLQKASKLNPHGIRIFHPAFPAQLLQPLSDDDFENFRAARQMLYTDSESKTITNELLGANLPWKVLPDMGVEDSKMMVSSHDIQTAYEKCKLGGHIVW